MLTSMAQHIRQFSGKPCETLRNLDNRQTQQFEVRMLPLLFALLGLVKEHYHCHHLCLFLSYDSLAGFLPSAGSKQ